MSETKDLEAEIAQTRQQLGQTVEALSDKLDVKSHVKSSADHARETAVQAVSSSWREIAVVAAWAALVTIVWRKF